MDLMDFYPPPTELVKSELKVLKHLMDDSYMRNHQTKFAQETKRSYSIGTSASSGLVFSSYLDVCHREAPWARKAEIRKEKLNTRLFICALIGLKKGAYSNISYCLSVLRIKSSS